MYISLSSCKTFYERVLPGNQQCEHKCVQILKSKCASETTDTEMVAGAMAASSSLCYLKFWMTLQLL